MRRWIRSDEERRPRQAGAAAIAALAVLLAAGCASQKAKAPTTKPPVVERSVPTAPPPPSQPPAPPRDELAERVAQRLGPVFDRARVEYPPQRAWLLAFKEERKLELWAAGERPTFIRSYRILAASGKPGPKLRQGDLQVPEGIYRVVVLNPQSAYHLSLGLDYPNDFDRAMAQAEGRTDLGGDIFLHGSNVSEGCLAMGDLAIEELYVLAQQVGLDHVEVVIAPNDLRRGDPPSPADQPAWVADLYGTLRGELARFRLD
jgi:hypothetical protein